jgi:Ser/Thr protein kinase RdoA (MazF antagonist)
VTPPTLVHGLAGDLVLPDWTPLAEEEVGAVLGHYPSRQPGDEPVITWRSPRPMSAAALVSWGGTEVFVKRHDPRVRNARQLTVEHAFAEHLRARGLPTPAVLGTVAGRTTITSNEGVYEVHQTASGVDLYRDAMSWTPFTSLGHAWAAGAALARFHQASSDFSCPARPPSVLTDSCHVITAADPLEAIHRLAASRPGLARYLAQRAWQNDLAVHHVPFIRRASPLLAGLERHWTHGDWHPSNLAWTSEGPDASVAAVFDLGLANLTFATHDLATALERSTVGWLDLSRTGRAEADLDAADALLDGYQQTRPLDAASALAVAAVLPVVHLEYALSEIEYFSDVVDSPANADLAYHGYLLGHTRWFETAEGSAMLDHLQQRLAP